MKPKLNILPNNPEEQSIGRFPSWLHRSLPRGKELFQTETVLRKHRLHTVCEEAKCPNRWECYANHTATFLALGKACTRNCGFCSIDFAQQPLPPEEDEPQRIALSAQELGLKHVVITMVARDDLADGGAAHIVRILHEVRSHVPHATLEVLTSDFSGNQKSLEMISDAKPHVFNHNIETVRSLTPRVRHKATYERTLDVLAFMQGKVPYLKSGFMVGLGETEQEVFDTIDDLARIGCRIITIGQYLQPTRHKLRVKSFVSQATYQQYKEYGLSIGIPQMIVGPFVRSSYHAHAAIE
jgi:lipoyl synthase